MLQQVYEELKESRTQICAWFQDGREDVGYYE
jgi:hypothetical protein